MLTTYRMKYINPKPKVRYWSNVFLKRVPFQENPRSRYIHPWIILPSGEMTSLYTIATWDWEHCIVHTVVSIASFAQIRLQHFKFSSDFYVIKSGVRLGPLQFASRIIWGAAMLYVQIRVFMILSLNSLY